VMTHWIGPASPDALIVKGCEAWSFDQAGQQRLPQGLKATRSHYNQVAYLIASVPACLTHGFSLISSADPYMTLIAGR
jgi:hypothetical protein